MRCPRADDAIEPMPGIGGVEGPSGAEPLSTPLELNGLTPLAPNGMTPLGLT